MQRPKRGFQAFAFDVGDVAQCATGLGVLTHRLQLVESEIGPNRFRQTVETGADGVGEFFAQELSGAGHQIPVILDDLSGLIDRIINKRGLVLEGVEIAFVQRERDIQTLADVFILLLIHAQAGLLALLIQDGRQKPFFGRRTRDCTAAGRGKRRTGTSGRSCRGACQKPRGGSENRTGGGGCRSSTSGSSSRSKRPGSSGNGATEIRGRITGVGIRVSDNPSASIAESNVRRTIRIGGVKIDFAGIERGLESLIGVLNGLQFDPRGVPHLGSGIGISRHPCQIVDTSGAARKGLGTGKSRDVFRRIQLPRKGSFIAQLGPIRFGAGLEQTLLVRRTGGEQLSFRPPCLSLGFKQTRLGLGLLSGKRQLRVGRSLNLLSGAQRLVRLERVYDGPVDAAGVHDPDVTRDIWSPIELRKLKTGSFEGHMINRWGASTHSN